MKAIFLRTASVLFLLFGVVNSVVAQPSYPTQPDQAQLIDIDLQNFANAFKRLNKTADTLAILQEFYFDVGSAGLKEYIGRHKLTATMLKDAIAQHPEKYKAVITFLEQRASFDSEFKNALQSFGNVLPKAMYPPTYLLVGANRGIAQASKVGQLVTITPVAKNPAKLKKMIVHELAHFQQAMAMGIQKYGALYGTPNNMLGLCLREGGAEFITSLVLGEITQAKTLDFYLSREAELKEKFKADLATQSQSYWMWDSVGDPNTPQLLGYVMGFKICEAFYKQASNKSNALKEILAMANAEAFLQTSAYFKD